jgi:hypothetical protein
MVVKSAWQHRNGMFGLSRHKLNGCGLALLDLGAILLR